MRLVLAGLAALAVGFAWTGEVLILNSGPTKVPRQLQSKGFELCNYGPNPIYCALGGNTDGGSPVYTDGGLVVRTTKARALASNACWSGEQPGTQQIWCIAGAADQVSGAATVITESP